MRRVDWLSVSSFVIPVRPRAAFGRLEVFAPICSIRRLVAFACVKFRPAAAVRPAKV